MKNLILYYIPFETQTYVPITRGLIEKQAHCIFYIPITDNSATLLKELTRETTIGNFDNLVVRLKIVGLDTDDIYVDQDGGIYSQAQEAKLTAEVFRQLKDLMAKLKTENPKDCRI